MIGSAAARVLYLPLAPRQVIPGRSSPPSRATQLYIPCRGAGWSSCRYIKSRALPVRAATAGPDGRDGGQVNGEGVLALGGDGRLNVDGVKSSLYQAVQGINRGIFGATSAKKAEIEGLVEQLESLNPIPNPTDQLSKLDGCWKLIYSTISILGSKRTKLGLRDFITLDDFLQTINSAQRKAINEIKFNARGFKMLSGQLTIVASFSVASKTRVDIKFESSEIAPDQLMNLFQKNYDMLLNIFNPDGWLEITYVDESFRIGRDDKGNVFILQRFKLDEI